VDQRGPGTDDGVEWVDLGELSTPPVADEVVGGPRLPVSRRMLGVAALVVLALVVLRAVLQAGSPSTDEARPAPSASAVAPGPVSATPGQKLAVGPPQPPRVTSVPAHVLGVRAGWELFGWGDEGVARLELAAGRLTLTPVPSIGSTGPVSFVVGSDRAVVRPLDDVAGYAVVDGRAAQPLTGALAGGGLMVPGPTPGVVWRATDDPIPSVVLTRLDGVETGVRATIPSDSSAPLVSDGSGYLLFVGTTGVYDIRPATIDRVTVGSVVAAGAGRVLAVECADQNRCATVVLNRVDGSRRVIGPGFSPPDYIGPISPDGRWAAVLFQSIAERLRLELVDLQSGPLSQLAVRPAPR
jgi:hypothetical protein